MDIFQHDYFWPFVALGAALIAAGVFLMFKFRGTGHEFDLQRKSRLLTPGERSFFDCLMPALKDDFFIFAKVAMLDVVAPRPTAGYFEKRKINTQLGGKCLDYVLCKKSDLSVFGVIELERFDKDTSKSQRAEREELVNSVCRAANLRLYYFDIRQDYQRVDIRRLVTGFAARKTDDKTASKPARSQYTIENSSYAAFAKQKSCPQCNGEVVTKVAAKGKHIGEKFLMCRKYPYCDYRVPMNEKMVQKEVREVVTEQRNIDRAGYKDWSAG